MKIFQSVALATGLLCSVSNAAAQPYMSALTTKPKINKVDLFFLIDDTASFVPYKPQIEATVTTLMSELQASQPEIEFGFGVGRFEDFGGINSSFGDDLLSARPFILNQPIVTSGAAGGKVKLQLLISSALDKTAPGNGGDGPEPVLEALRHVVDGSGFDGGFIFGDVGTTGQGGFQPAGASDTQTAPDVSGDVPAFSSLVPTVLKSGTVGGAGFRSDAYKLVVVFTDACPVAAFDRALGIPATVSGNGTSERVEEFGCDFSENPEENRFGFVSSSKVSRGLFDVVPAGAYTLQDTITALNAGGVRVMGVVPGAAPAVVIPGLTGPDHAWTPKGSGPSVDASPWLSAIARLTGALDASGNPQVFFMADAAEQLKANIVSAVTVTETCSIEQCVNIDVSGKKAALVEGSLTLKNVIVRATKQLEKYGRKAKTRARALRKMAETIDASNLTLTINLPNFILDCPSTPCCVKSSNQSVLDAYRANSAKLLDVMKKVVSELKRHRNSERDNKRRLQNANKIHANNVAASVGLPTETATCVDSE